MPDLAAQARIPPHFTAASRSSGRLLRRREPTSRPSPSSRRTEASASLIPTTPAALARIAHRSRQFGKPAYVFVNNRLEGHAPTTIEAVTDALEMGG